MLRYPFSRKKAQKKQADAVQESPCLEKLAQSLQPVLQTRIMAYQLQVRCAIRQGTLFVLTEHLLHVEPDPQQTFAHLEAIVRENVADQIQDPFFSPQDHKALSVRLFLRIAGHQQPYQFHTFSVSLLPADDAKPLSFRDESPQQALSVPIESPSLHSVNAQPEVPETIEPVAIEPAEVDAPEVEPAGTAAIESAELHSANVELAAIRPTDAIAIELAHAAAAPEVELIEVAAIEPAEIAAEVAGAGIIAAGVAEVEAAPEAIESAPDDLTESESAEYTEEVQPAAIESIAAAQPDELNLTGIEAEVEAVIEPASEAEVEARFTEPEPEAGFTQPEVEAEAEVEAGFTEPETIDRAEVLLAKVLLAEVEPVESEAIELAEIKPAEIEPAEIEPADADAATALIGLQGLETIVAENTFVEPLFVEPLFVEPLFVEPLFVEPIADVVTEDELISIESIEPAVDLPAAIEVPETDAEPPAEQEILLQGMTLEEVTPEEVTLEEVIPEEVTLEKVALEEITSEVVLEEITPEIAAESVSVENEADRSIELAHGFDTESYDINSPDIESYDVIAESIPEAIADPIGEPAPGATSEPTLESVAEPSWEFVSEAALASVTLESIADSDSEADFDSELEAGLDTPAILIPSASTVELSPVELTAEPTVDEMTEAELQQLEWSATLPEQLPPVLEAVLPEPITEPITGDVASEQVIEAAALDLTDALSVNAPVEAIEETVLPQAELSAAIESGNSQAEVLPEAIDQEATLVEAIGQELIDQEVIDKTRIDQEAIDQGMTLAGAIDQEATLAEAIGQKSIDQAEVLPEAIDPEATLVEAIGQELIDQEAIDQETTLAEAIDQETIEQEVTDQEAIDQEAIDQEAIDQAEVLPEAIDSEVTLAEAIGQEAVDQTKIDQTIDQEEAVLEEFPSEAVEQEKASQNVDDITESSIDAVDGDINYTESIGSAPTSKELAAVNPPIYPATAAPTAAPADLKNKGLSFAEVLELEAWSDRQSLLKRMSLSAKIFVGTAGVFAIVAGMYALTRPCVMGECPPIQQAEQISDRAINTIQTTESALAIVDAYDQLREVNGLLSPIPFWSPHYGEAQNIMIASEARASRVAQLVNALKKANEAAQKSQNPPHPLPQWREIQWLWRDAIATLQKIPADSPIHDLAQRRLKEYEANLAMINQRVAIEQAAQNRVSAARKTAEVAEAQEGIAKTAQDWQQSYAAWQAAVQALDQIPQGTMAHAEADQLLALYQPRLQEADQRRGQESIAETAFLQANQLAAQARSLEQLNDWSEAKTVWQQAVANLQRIPQTTGYYARAQSTIQSYRSAVTQAEKNVARLTAMRSVQPSLDLACAGAVPFCTYSFTPQAIRVQITRSYDQATEQVMTAAQGNAAMQAVLTNQVSNLLRSLAAISETAQVPIELYNANGSRFGTYSPEASGFVAQ